MIPYLDGPSLWGTAAAAAVTASMWIVVLAAYRLLLGPLARFPGPRLAALTGWYETYFECWRRGRYWVEIEHMHEKYGSACPSHTDYCMNLETHIAGQDQL
jgi:hypothetical protein